MSRWIYPGTVVRVASPASIIADLDLGFRVHTRRLIKTEPSEVFTAGEELVAAARRNSDGSWLIDVRPAGDDEFYPWTYPATLIRVVDGDTFDARVNLGCDTFIEERFRLERVSAPEIFGKKKGTPEYERGLLAKLYVEETLRISGGHMFISSSRRGKWRRWLAWVRIPGEELALNIQIVTLGFATWAHS